jgi:hypothetical protein
MNITGQLALLYDLYELRKENQQLYKQGCQNAMKMLENLNIQKIIIIIVIALPSVQSMLIQIRWSPNPSQSGKPDPTGI